MPLDELPPSSLLFSYGTLQRGERAQHHLSTAIYLGEVRTTELFLLVDCGQFPGLIAEPTHSSASHIFGELYQVPDHLWPTLDDYEGIHLGEYRRAQIRITDADHSEKTVQAYLWTQEWTHLPVVGASWKTYRRRYFPTA